MSNDPDVTNLQRRIAKAESDMGHWRTTGNQEKYLENHSLVEALELELDRLRKQRLRDAARGSQFEMGDPPREATQDRMPAPREASERKRLMLEHAITP